MIKYLLFILILLVPTSSLGWGIITFSGNGASSSGGGGCDDCSGTLIMAIRFEDGSDPSDIDDSGVSPCGCTDGSDDTADLVNGAVISSNSTYIVDSYGVDFRGESDSVEVDNTGLSVSYNTTGTWCGTYYKSDSGAAAIFDVGDPLGSVQDGAGADDNTLRSYYGSDYYSGSDTFADTTKTRICLSYDASQSAGSDGLATKVGSNSWQSNDTLTLTDNAALASPVLIAGGVAYGRGYIDDIKWYSDYQHNE